MAVLLSEPKNVSILYLIEVFNVLILIKLVFSSEKQLDACG